MSHRAEGLFSAQPIALALFLGLRLAQLDRVVYAADLPVIRPSLLVDLGGASLYLALIRESLAIRGDSPPCEIPLVARMQAGDP